MGMNTAMIIRNDFLHEIENDPGFGKKVAEAIRYVGYPNPPYHGQAFDVLRPCHADYAQVIVISGNAIRRIEGYAGMWENTDEEIIRKLAYSMGYSLRKKRSAA